MSSHSFNSMHHSLTTKEEEFKKKSLSTDESLCSTAIAHIPGLYRIVDWRNLANWLAFAKVLSPHVLRDFNIPNYITHCMMYRNVFVEIFSYRKGYEEWRWTVTIADSSAINVSAKEEMKQIRSKRAPYLVIHDTAIPSGEKDCQAQCYYNH